MTGNNFLRQNIDYIYWSLPIILLIAQAFYTFGSMNQIRTEELDLIRGTYWFANRHFFGVSLDLGWYFLLMLYYNFFGFDLFGGKIIRLFLHLVSLYALFYLAKRYLPSKYNFLPIITFGLSPAVLYYTAVQTSYGIEFQVLPIIFFLLSSIKPKEGIKTVFKQVLLGAAVMIAWLLYRTVMFYIPLLVYLYARVYWRRVRYNSKKLFLLFLPAFSFFGTLILFTFYLKESPLFFSGLSTPFAGGLFKGIVWFDFSLHTFIWHSGMLIKNLFYKSSGYFYEISKVDFSDYYPIATFFIVIAVSLFLLIKDKKLSGLIKLAYFVIVSNFIVVNFVADDYPSLNRYTPILFCFYFLYALAWNYLIKRKKSRLKFILVVLMILLPIHHILVFKTNLDYLKNSDEFQEKNWFTLVQKPTESLDLLVNQVQKEDLTLSCVDKDGKTVLCRLDRVFSAISSKCYWDRLLCHDIKGYDPQSGDFKVLTVEQGLKR